ncbi:MAG: hypothetical protein J6K98_01665, partial [Clostridia bacterium]|nr:hypothetical protein [Clostridia bacterium]
MNKWITRLLAAAAALLLLVMPVSAGVTPVEEEPMYSSYTYAVSRGKLYALEAPAPYRVEAQVNAASLGVPLKSPVDLCVYNNEVFIVDQTNNCVLHTDADFNVIETISGFTMDGKPQTFSGPEGVSVTKDH